MKLRELKLNKLYRRAIFYIFCHLCDIDAVVSRDVLVADASGDGEPQALGALEQLDLDQLLRVGHPLGAGVLASLDGQNHPVPGSLQSLHRYGVTHVDYRHVVHLK